jgi:hypothetical protein
MPHPKVDDATFIRLFRTFGAAGVQKQIGGNLRSIYARRRNVEKNNGTQIKSPNDGNSAARQIEYPHRAKFDIQNGVVLVGSDAHIWPGPSSPALRGFRFFAKELKPKLIVLNGDVLDFPQISRHDPIGWEGWPSVKAELEAAQDELHELALAAPRGCEKVWTLGNHDARFESRLANAAPEFARFTAFISAITSPSGDLPGPRGSTTKWSSSIASRAVSMRPTTTLWVLGKPWSRAICTRPRSRPTRTTTGHATGLIPGVSLTPMQKPS